MFPPNQWIGGYLLLIANTRLSIFTCRVTSSPKVNVPVLQHFDVSQPIWPDTVHALTFPFNFNPLKSHGNFAGKASCSEICHADLDAPGWNG
jgi:hypothetical protein